MSRSARSKAKAAKDGERRNLATRPFATEAEKAAPPPRETTVVSDSVHHESRLFGVPTARIVEIAIAAIIIPLLGYLALKVTTLDSTLTSTEKRLDRLFAAVPELRVQLAEERARAPIKAAVIATTPTSPASDAYVHLVDIEKETAQTLVVPASVARRADYALALRGFAFGLNAQADTFANFSKYCAAADKPLPVFPSSIDQNLSFALTIAPSTDVYVREVAALKGALGARAIKHGVPLRESSFDAIAADICAQPARWTAVPTSERP